MNRDDCSLGFERVTACCRGCACVIMVIGVKCLTGKFLMQTTGGMLVNVNHDGISVAEIVLSPKAAVGDAAFDNWFVLAHFLSPRLLLSPRHKPDIPRQNAR